MGGQGAVIQLPLCFQLRPISNQKCTIMTNLKFKALRRGVSKFAFKDWTIFQVCSKVEHLRTLNLRDCGWGSWNNILIERCIVYNAYVCPNVSAASWVVFILKDGVERHPIHSFRSLRPRLSRAMGRRRTVLTHFSNVCKNLFLLPFRTIITSVKPVSNVFLKRAPKDP